MIQYLNYGVSKAVNYAYILMKLSASLSSLGKYGFTDTFSTESGSVFEKTVFRIFLSLLINIGT